MDAVTSFIYGMSMMFFSMMAWMFWRKGSERLFRLIMLLMLIADAQCLKDLVLFYYKGFGSTEGWYFTSPWFCGRYNDRRDRNRHEEKSAGVEKGW